MAMKEAVATLTELNTVAMKTSQMVATLTSQQNVMISKMEEFEKKMDIAIQAMRSGTNMEPETNKASTLLKEILQDNRPAQGTSVASADEFVTPDLTPIAGTEEETKTKILEAMNVEVTKRKVTTCNSMGPVSVSAR